MFSSTAEDVALANALVQCSENPLQGIDMKKEDFWEEVERVQTTVICLYPENYNEVKKRKRL